VTIEPSNAKAYAFLATALESDLFGRHMRRGCDVPGAVAALRKAKALDPTDAALRARLADLLTYDDRPFKFSRNAHLDESIDEYKSLLKDLGKDAAGYEPPLMLALSHAGRWNEVKEMAKKETDPQQRDLFHIISVVATEGTAAGLKELSAFDDATRQNYGAAVARTMMSLRRYSDAADMFEAASKGSAQASQMLAIEQVLRKTQPYEKTIDDGSFKSLLVKTMVAVFSNDWKLFSTLVVPELDRKSMADRELSLHAMLGDNETNPDVIIDLFCGGVELQQDGNDEVGYRLRLRSNFGAATASHLSYFLQRRDGKYLIAAMSMTPDTIGRAALKLANDGKIEAARIWLNWARESISVGGGDDPLAGPAFPRLWQKEKPKASLDEIKLAAASLMVGETYASESAPLLATLRDSAPTDDARAAVDMVLIAAYARLRDYEKLVPIAERLSKAHPDSGSAFTSWARGLMMIDQNAAAEMIAKERLARLPKDADAMRALARICAKRGDYAGAVSWSRRTVDEITPTLEDYNETAWLTLFLGKDLDRGVDDARRATADDARATYASLNTLAALYAEIGKSVESRQALLKAMDRRGSDEPGSDDWFVLGRIAENYGVRDVALSSYNHVEKGALTGTSGWELTQKRIAAMGSK
jgi:tetratricopeptide (TPR) repeat protein